MRRREALLLTGGVRAREPISVFRVDGEIVTVNLHLLRQPPQRVHRPAPGHPRPGAASQQVPRAQLAAHFDVRGQVLLGAEGLGAGGAGVAPLPGVHGGQVAVQVRAVPEVLQAVRALHQLLLVVDGLLVAVGVGLEGEAGGALRAEVALRRRLRGRPAEGLAAVEGLGSRLVAGRRGAALGARPVQRQRHEGQRVAVLVLPEVLQAAEQPLAQGAGEPGPGAGPRPGLFGQERWREAPVGRRIRPRGRLVSTRS